RGRPFFLRFCGYAVHRMRKGLISVLIALAGLLGAAGESGAAQCTLRVTPGCFFPSLVATLGGSVSPKTLSASKHQPVTWSIFGKIGTSDGTHPSALREVQLDVDKDVRINSRNYPVCEMGGRAIREESPKAAEKACAKALVGRGEATVELAFPETTPTELSSQLLVFNAGEQGGVTKLLIHAFIYVPVPTPIVSVLTVSKHGAGLETVTEIPVIAGGSGSLLDFKLKIGRTYSYAGKKYGYFEAKCPDSVFKANVKSLLFKNEAKVPGVAAQSLLKAALAVPCTPKG
ncbi:MAG: hypothetical protein ABW196_06425, partial [Solirubrobacterales bacterium]